MMLYEQEWLEESPKAVEKFDGARGFGHSSLANI